MEKQVVNASLIKDYCLEKKWAFYEYSKPETLHFLTKNLKKPNQLQVVAYGQSHVYLACMHNVAVFAGRFVRSEADGNIFLHGLTHNNTPTNLFNRLEQGNSLSVGQNNIAQIKVGEPNKSYDEAVLISGSPNFGHWMVEHVLRLAILELHPHLKKLKLLITNDTPKRFLGFLSLLGFKEDQFCLINHSDVVTVSRLWVPSVPYYMGHYSDKKMYISPDTIHLLRYAFLQERSLLSTQHASKKSRIYVSRKQAKWRRLVNEDAVVEVLKKYGFQTVYMEELSPQEQIDLISQVEILVMPIGGSSMVSIFAPKNAIIIEFTYKGFHYDPFTAVDFCRALGQPYHKIIGEPVSLPEERKGTVTEKFDYDFKISLNDLSEILQKVEQMTNSVLSFSQELHDKLFR
ncbi:glycosyltransferase 61 family protein [Candidatus Albibeggiatoa sp. nov. NOAA]|uniref:glycosyltransferase family 61 protein n=1 Tax=Candidatus Albibeggiatoa sp. nov. NOAA TaxID=3162724 RepID=UPI003300BCAF|nr:glycosyltransferase family 61 protein [Thiotrichaceae bacterium]